ncbi:MAG: ABC transporter permease [Myxococcales bacterium]|nr:MAG: ABC transporter permease [Myxococcales bacterium]
MIGLVIVSLFFFLALIGPSIAPYSPDTINLNHEYILANANHLLGTTDNGVDILSVLLHGARLAAVVSLCVVFLSTFIGGILGMVAAYFGKTVDQIVSGFADMVQAFPSILLNIGIVALVAHAGLSHLIFALVATGWVLYARIARAETLSIKERDYISSAKALGYNTPRTLLRHILPNIAAPMLIQASTGMGSAIVAESTLSFLGLGPGTTSSWGTLLDQGSAVLLRFPHVALYAGSTIAITVLGFNLFGDWLRDRLDPTRQHS